MKKTQLKTRYYFWDWCKSYGWRQTGYMNGYDSIKKLKKDQDFAINGDKDYAGADNWKILKATIIESKK